MLLRLEEENHWKKPFISIWYVLPLIFCINVTYFCTCVSIVSMWVSSYVYFVCLCLSLFVFVSVCVFLRVFVRFFECVFVCVFDRAFLCLCFCVYVLLCVIVSMCVRFRSLHCVSMFQCASVCINVWQRMSVRVSDCFNICVSVVVIVCQCKCYCVFM